MRRAVLTGLALTAALASVGTPDVHAADDAEPGPWEEVVFLPESALGVLLERDPRGVLLERRAYLDLYRRARAAGSASAGSLSGVPGGVLRCEVDGVLDESSDVAQFEVRLTVNARGEGRQTVPLALGGAVVAARIGDAPATLGVAGDGLTLLLPSAGLHEVVLTVVAPVLTRRGVRNLSLLLPTSVATRWSLTLPGRVTATADGALSRSERLSGPDRTRLVGFGPLRTSWREGESGTDLPPLVRATVNTLAEVGARAMDVTALVRIDCWRSPRDTFPLRLPADLTVLGADGHGASLGTTAGGGRELRFAEPFTGSRVVMLRASRTLTGPGTTALPVLDMPGATTVSRLLGVRFTDGLRGVVDAGDGAERLDPALSQQGAVNALLRVSADAQPQVQTERPAGRLRAEVRALLDLADDGPWLTVAILYRPQGDRLYGVDPLLPAGFLPETVQTAPPLDLLRGTTPDGRLSLVFPAGVDDGGAVTVTIRGRWPQPGWTADAWSAGGDARDAPLPRLDGGTAAETEGFLGVAVPTGTEVRDEDSTGLVPAAVSELRERASFLADGLTLGWRFRGTAPGGRLRVTRPEASLTASTALLVVPAETHVSLAGRIGLAVQRGGVREVRVRVTPGLGDLLRIEGADVAEKRREAGADGADVWVVRFARVIRDGATLLLSAELPLASGATVAVPAVTVLGATRTESEVGVAAAGELDVSIEAAGLREADQAELSPLLAGHPSGLLRAWRVDRDATPTLAVGAARLAPSPLPATFADSVVLRSVIGMDDIVRTRLDARIRNVDRQALEVVLPPGARLSTARVAGKAVRPVQRAGVLLVPIVPSPAPFDVVLFYEEPAPEGATAATLSAPDLGIPGNRATWTVYLPEGALPLEADGDFAAPAPPPGSPLLWRWLTESTASVTSERIWTAEDAGAAASMPEAARAPRPRPPRRADADDGEDKNEEVPADSREPSDPMPPPEADGAAGPTTGGEDFGGPAGGKLEPATQRIQGRAAERGLFGMDLRLLAAGPSITATRLGPTGTVHVDWRSETWRNTVALLAALLAFVAGFWARRRGFGALTWALLALGAFTALPVVFGVVDTSAWDGAALGTLAFAALALLRCVGGWTARWTARRRWLRGSARAAAAALLVALVFASAAPAHARDEKAPPDPPTSATGTVFVPFDPDRPETLRVPERVFLPYARYRELWNRAHPEERISSKLPPVVVSAEYEGRIEGRVLVLAATYVIDPADGGVVALPPGAAVEGLTLDGAPVTATASAPGGATLVHVPRATAGARVVLAATLRWPVGGAAPGGVLTTPLPRAPSASLVLDVPLADAVVGVMAEGGQSTEPSGSGTRLTAALGPVSSLELTWRPRGADAAGGRTRFEVDTESVASIGPGVVEWSAELTLRVLSGTIQELDAVVPAELEITSVEGPAVASWTVENGTSLRLRLLGVAPGESPISLRGVVPFPAAAAVLSVPDVVVTGASADRHRMAVAASGLRIVPVERTGVERTDAAGGAATGTLAFRRVRTPSRLRVRAEPQPGGLAVVARHHLHLGAERSLLRTELDLTPGPQGLYEARVELPAGWTLDDDAGADVFVEGGTLRLVFPGATNAARTVVLRLRGPAAGDAAFAVPVLRVVDAARESAELLVSTIPAFAATVAVQENAEPLPAARFARWPPLGDREVRALAWRTPRGAPRVEVLREELQTTLRPTVVADLTVLDDRVIVDALVHWEIRGGPERVFRVDAPPGVRDAWVLGEGLREVRREDVNGRERLIVTLQAATTGAVAFRVLYDLPVPASGQIEVAGPEPVDGDGARSFLLLRALGESEVRLGDAPSLETCDVADLPLIPQGLDPLQILRFLRARDAAWRLPLTLAAHELGELPEARIHLVEATTVADRDGSTRTRIEARLFNRARAFLPVRLPAGGVLESVIVAGAPVRPVVRSAEPGVVQVPIRVQSLGEDSQVVALTFRTPASAPGERFDELTPHLAEFPGVPVDATTWRVVLPADREYSFSGNLDPVEEVEVAIARAEAYASDVKRLRTVFQKGSRQQQAVAAQNIMSNTAELKETLDLARSRMESLEQAAAEGRVDQERLRASRRKADELAKDIEQVLEEVAQAGDRTAETRGGGYRGPAGEMPPTGGEEIVEAEKQLQSELERTRFVTKEGQAGKKWGANAFGDQDMPQQEDAQPGGMPQGGGGAAPGAATAVVDLANQAFDNALQDRESTIALLRAGAEFQSDAPFEAPANETIGVGHVGTTTATRYAIGMGGGAGSGFRARDEFGRRPGARGQAGVASDSYLAPAVSGLISLEPQLVQEGRTYAFRKLEANAELEISTATPGKLRRWTALGLLALLVLVVLGVRRRSIARRA